MKLKGLSKIQLAKIFMAGDCPRAGNLLGPDRGLSEWRVDMLTGPIPNLGGRWFRHRKQFHVSTTGQVMGCNILFDDTRWGYFVLDDVDTYEEADDRKVLFINYKQPENGTLTRGRIRDYVRTTHDVDVLIGEFYYNFGAFEVFRTVGPYYFSLTRIKPCSP